VNEIGLLVHVRGESILRCSVLQRVDTAADVRYCGEEE
jgi:hypothetical protein